MTIGRYHLCWHGQCPFTRVKARPSKESRLIWAGFSRKVKGMVYLILGNADSKIRAKLCCYLTSSIDGGPPNIEVRCEEG
jgi:IS1 family transposase